MRSACRVEANQLEHGPEPWRDRQHAFLACFLRADFHRSDRELAAARAQVLPLEREQFSTATGRLQGRDDEPLQPRCRGGQQLHVLARLEPAVARRVMLAADVGQVTQPRSGRILFAGPTSRGSWSPVAPSRPTSPTSPNALRGALTITNLTLQGAGTPGAISYRLSMRLSETGGRTVTLNTVTYRFNDGRTSVIQGQGATVRANTSQPIGPFRTTDSTGSLMATQVTITIAYTDEGQQQGTVPSSASVTHLVLVTLSGSVRDDRGTAVAGAAIEVTSLGENNGLKTTSDANGRYALQPLVPGSFRVRVMATGYVIANHDVAIDRDTPFDVTLRRIPPAVEYRITGTARTCDVTYQNASGGTSQRQVTVPWSFAWSSAKAGDFLYCRARSTNRVIAALSGSRFTRMAR